MLILMTNNSCRKSLDSFSMTKRSFFIDCKQFLMDIFNTIDCKDFSDKIPAFLLQGKLSFHKKAAEEMKICNYCNEFSND